MRLGAQTFSAEQQSRLLLGDCVEVLQTLPEASVEAVVTDPPYDLLQASRRGSARSNEPDNPYGRHGSRGGFMGMAWDATGVAFRRDTWEAVLRVLRPGGHLLAFGGTRTQHRMTCAIEDAGFEIRDSISWLYGSGFPKSRDIGRTLEAAAGPKDAATVWQGWGTALKPAHEPIIVARKPLSESSVAANVLAHRTGALNVDGCRLEFASATDEAHAKVKNRHEQFGSGQRHNRIYGRDLTPQRDYSAPGRWPTNVILSHSQGCEMVGRRQVCGTNNTDAETIEPWRCVAGCPVAELDRQSGSTRSRSGRPRSSSAPGHGYGMTHTGAEYDDLGGASRFFYIAKASTRERNFGLDDVAESLMSSPSTSQGCLSPAGKDPARNHHPCVKPITLMRYLCRLVTPPGGTVLDPFMGSGSTGVAAALEEFAFIGIERDETYLEIAKARILHAISGMEAGAEEVA